ncbi:hypothetical protein [Shewanella nanhaiensis]|uniref:Uncharacterized protein n=1 Tax=Shewanella nanhaiensis TaxID=2864872 RepID=A0ABS7DYD7_9GAMM|nr:hypothetical protein [Shewanella nanhaiensis]MBW8182441.1 hypothetical protein [Shewanella nanhaiensis]
MTFSDLAYGWFVILDLSLSSRIFLAKQGEGRGKQKRKYLRLCRIKNFISSATELLRSTGDYGVNS